MNKILILLLFMGLIFAETTAKKTQLLPDTQMDSEQVENIPKPEPLQARRTPFDERFQQGNLLQGLDPMDEELHKRTQISKKFRITEDQVRVIIGPEFHYMDENNLWQDINTNIQETGDFNLPFENITNSIHTYFPMDWRCGPIVRKDGAEVTIGKNHKILSGSWKPRNSLVSELPTIDANVITYPEIFAGIDLQYKLYPSLLEHIVLFKDESCLQGLEDDLVVTETIEIPKGAKLLGDYGVIDDLLEIEGRTYVVQGSDTLYVILASRAYDAAYTGNTIDPTAGGELEIPDNFIFARIFVQKISSTEFEFRSVLKRDWLLSEDRVWPITLDPTIGPIPGGPTESGYMYPWQTGYRQRSSQCLYLQSEIGYAGDIDRIAFEQSAANGLNNSNARVQLKHSSTSSFDTPTFETTGWSTGYSGTLYYTSGTGWRWIDLTTDFTYNNSNNLQIETRFYNSSAVAAGGWVHRSVAPYYGHKWGRGNNNNYPPDDTWYGSNVPLLQLDIVDVPTEHCYTPTSYDYGTYYPTTSWTPHSQSFEATGCRMYRFYLYDDREYDFSCCSSDGGGGSGTTGDVDFTMYNSSGTSLWTIDGPSACSYDATTIGSTYELWIPPSTGYYYLRVEEYYDSDCDYTLAYKYTAGATDHCYDCPTYDHGTYTPSISWNTHSTSFGEDGCRFYRFNLTAGNDYIFKTGCEDGATADFDTHLELYNSSCTSVESDDDGCESNRSELVYSCTSSDYYYLKVRGYGSDYGSYTLAYRNEPGECVSCPSYDFGTYTPSSSWQTHDASIGADGCRFYRFTLTAGQDYSFKTGCDDGATAEFDTYLELYNSSCSNVANDDDGCESNRSHIEYTCTSSGTYYLKVRGYSSSHLGDYTLAYRYNPDECLTCPSYDFGTYTPALTWNTHSTSYGIEGCRWYRFTLTSGREYTFKTGCDDGATADFDTYLELYNASCSNVANDDDGCESNRSEIVYTCTSSGYYYLKVRGFSSAYGSYTLAYNYSNPCVTPGTPIASAPTGITDTGADFSWSAGSPTGDPTVTYYWAVGTSSGVTYESGYIDRGTTTGFIASTSSLSPDQTYYFRLKACTSCDGSCSAYTTYETFNTEYCNTCGTYDFGSYTPTTSWATHSSSVGEGGSTSACRWYQFYVTSSRSYSFSMCDGGGAYTNDTEMWLYNASCGLITSNDDYCGLGSQISWTADFTGNVYLKVASHNSSACTWTLAYRYVEGCSAPTLVSASSDESTICSGDFVDFQYTGHSGGVCTGSWQYEWRTGSGTVVRAWSTSPSFFTSLTSTATYYLYMRCSDCTGDVSPASSGVTVTVYNDIGLGTWTGYVDDEWTNPENWGRCTAPTISTDVTIPNTPLYGRFPKINTSDGSCVCHDITNDGTLNGGAGNNLTVYGDFMNNGIFNCETGVIIFDGGESEQHIGGINPSIFSDIHVDKSTGRVVLDRNITILENLNMLYPGPHRMLLDPYQITFVP